MTQASGVRRLCRIGPASTSRATDSGSGSVQTSTRTSARFVLGRVASILVFSRISGIFAVDLFLPAPFLIKRDLDQLGIGIIQNFAFGIVLYIATAMRKVKGLEYF